MDLWVLSTPFAHETLTTVKTDARLRYPMYRPSKRPPRGIWARHLQEQRRLRDISAVVAFELVYERIGWSPKSRSAYVAIDSGDRQPKGIEVTVLGAEFGWPPDPDDVEEAATDQASLIAALAAQTAAINRLVDRLESLAPIAIRQGVAAELRAAGLIPASGESPDLPPPGQSS